MQANFGIAHRFVWTKTIFFLCFHPTEGIFSWDDIPKIVLALWYFTPSNFRWLFNFLLKSFVQNLQYDRLLILSSVLLHRLYPESWRFTTISSLLRIFITKITALLIVLHHGLSGVFRYILHSFIHWSRSISLWSFSLSKLQHFYPFHICWLHDFNFSLLHLKNCYPSDHHEYQNYRHTRQFFCI